MKRIEQEGSVLKSLPTPQHARLIEFGTERQFTYLVFDYLPGITLEERLDQKSLTTLETVYLARMLLKALHEITTMEFFTVVSKPSNIIVNELPSPLSQVALIDFGIAQIDQQNFSNGIISIKSIQYLAPEQAGSLDRTPGPPSDLYSLGCVLYECLASQPPFEEIDARKTLRRHLVEKPAALSTSNRSIPQALEAFIQLLLKKDPNDRYQSAEAALADLEQIESAFSNGNFEPAFHLGLPANKFTLSDPSFIGRTEELALLKKEFDQTATGKSSLVFIEAESGGGKKSSTQ